MPILRLHSIFPILESLYGRIPSLICIEIINLKNHSWQVSWNVKADIIIIMVTYRHAVPRKKRTDFNLSATRKPKFLVMPKASSIRTNLYTTQRDYMFFFSVSNLAFGFVLWQIWCSYYLEREWILLICIFETRTSMPYLASMYICICCLLGCQKKISRQDTLCQNK